MMIHEVSPDGFRTMVPTENRLWVDTVGVVVITVVGIGVCVCGGVLSDPEHPENNTNATSNSNGKDRTPTNRITSMCYITYIYLNLTQLYMGNQVCVIIPKESMDKAKKRKLNVSKICRNAILEALQSYQVCIIIPKERITEAETRKLNIQKICRDAILEALQNQEDIPIPVTQIPEIGTCANGAGDPT